MKLSDEKYIKENAHITSDEVRQDIADTQREIDEIQSRVVNPRLEIGKSEQIRERQSFIDDLKRLLRLRGEE